MYSSGTTLPVEGVDPGTNVVCLGPPLTDKWRTLSALATVGLDDGEGCLVVTSDESVSRLREQYPTLDSDGVRFVDCTRSTPDDTDVRSIASPADLTGLSIALSEAFEDLSEAGYDRIRVVIDSVTTLSIYADPKRLYRFVHTLTQQIEARGAVGFYVVDDEEDEFLQTVLPLFDERIEFRDGERGSMLRVVRDDTTTQWVSVGGSDATVAPPSQRPDAPTPESLQAVFEQVASERLTLFVVNAPDDARAELERLLSRLNVEVRGATLPDGPASFVVLSRGDELVAAEPVERVRVSADGFEGDQLPDQRDLSTVFSEVVAAEFGVRNVTRRELVRTSRLFERAARRREAGTLHAGFQRLSRIGADERTHDLYQALADTEVDIHLYGEPDADPGIEGATVHGSDAAEIRDSWFVAYDGAGDPDRMGALLCFERKPGSYDGFWTFRPEIVAGLVSYLESTYDPTEAVA